MGARSALVLVMVVGCGASGPEYFAPTEHASASAADGIPESIYDLVIAGERLGEVKVWSAGAYDAQVKGGDEQTIVHVAVEIENTSGQAVVIDPTNLRLESIAMNDRFMPAAPMLSLAGELTVAPNTTGTVEAYFVLPADIEPQNVDSFSLRWAVALAQDDTPAAQRYAQVTPFREYTPVDYAGGGSIYYDRYYPYYPYGYVYDWSFFYPYHSRSVTVRHHFPHRTRDVRDHRSVSRRVSPPKAPRHQAVRPEIRAQRPVPAQPRPHARPNVRDHRSGT